MTAPDFPALVAAARLKLGSIERTNPSGFADRVSKHLQDYRHRQKHGDAAGRLNAAAFLAARCELHAAALAAVEAAAGRPVNGVPEAPGCPPALRPGAGLVPEAVGAGKSPSGAARGLPERAAQSP